MTNEQYIRRAVELADEVEEQARLNGMGAERELALLAKIDCLEKKIARLDAYTDHLHGECVPDCKFCGE